MGVVSTPAAPLRTLRVAAAYLVRGVARGGCERVEERGARVRARGKVGLYFITGIKETQNGTRAARTRARITSTLTQQIKDAGSGSGEGFFDQKGTSANLCTAHTVGAQTSLGRSWDAQQNPFDGKGATGAANSHLAGLLMFS